MVKSNLQLSSQRQRQTHKDDICRENSLKESCFMFNTVKLNILLQTKSRFNITKMSISSVLSANKPQINSKPLPSKPSRSCLPMLLALIFLYVEDQH